MIDNTDDNYQLDFKGPDGTSTGDFSVTGAYQSFGLYKADYIPQEAGEYILDIKLLGLHINDSPFTVKVSPGDIDGTKCTTDVSAPVSMTAGDTYSFKITSYDMYNNRLPTVDDSVEILSLAKYQNHAGFTSPISIPDLTNW